MRSISKHIALTLKALRKERGWSLDKTAQETGVSKAMLGQIERQESSPTIATLWKIASGFHTSFSSFLEEFPVDSKKHIHRMSTAWNLSSKEKKIRITPIFPFDKQLHCEIFIIELLPDSEHLSSPHLAGVIEHVIVAQGTMGILLNDVWQTLCKDEGLRFNADQPHGYRNTTSKIVRFHNIIHYP
jgi:XRE family transcriptional regulator, regulator of sulfur utilization